jgi:hypothetical protein
MMGNRSSTNGHTGHGLAIETEKDGHHPFQDVDIRRSIESLGKVF